jgi:hypothetical protein
MRRIHVVFAALAIVVTSFAAFSGPAMAQDDLNCRDARGDLIRCDGELYEPYYNTSGYNDYPPFYFDYNDYYPPFYSPFYNDYSYMDYNDFVDEYENAVDDYLDDYEDSFRGYYSYNW